MQIGLTFPDGMQKILELPDAVSVPSVGDSLYFGDESISGRFFVASRQFQLTKQESKTYFGWSFTLKNQLE